MKKLHNVCWGTVIWPSSASGVQGKASTAKALSCILSWKIASRCGVFGYFLQHFFWFRLKMG